MRSCIKRSLSIFCVLLVFCLSLVPAMAADQAELPVLLHRVDYGDSWESIGIVRTRTSPLSPYDSGLFRATLGSSSIGSSIVYNGASVDDPSVANFGVTYLYHVEPGMYNLTFAYQGHLFVRLSATDTVPNTNFLTSARTVYEGDSPDGITYVNVVYSVPEGSTYLKMSSGSYVVNASVDYTGFEIKSVEQGSMESFLSSLHNVVFAVFNDVSSIGSTIMGQPILLLTIGLLILGGAIGIFWRTLKRE